MAGRDKTRLVAGVEDQVRAVAHVLPTGVAVRGALQFVDGDLAPADLERLRLLLERALPAA